MTPVRVTEPPLPRNHLRSSLLLLLAEGASHGYELLDRARSMGLVNTDAAAVYRCLRTMDEQSLVHSEWEPSSSGPARRIYYLTKGGRERLDEVVSLLNQTVLVLGDFLDRYEGVSSAKVPAR